MPLGLQRDLPHVVQTSLSHEDSEPGIGHLAFELINGTIAVDEGDILTRRVDRQADNLFPCIDGIGYTEGTRFPGVLSASVPSTR